MFKMPRANFIGGLKKRDKTEITLAVSMNNPRGIGIYIEAFVVLINRLNSNKKEGKRIIKVKVLPGFWVHRHYYGINKVVAVEKTWRENHEPFFKRLTVPYEVLDWKEITETRECKDFLSKVEMLYKDDDGYKTRVDNQVNRHALKASEKKAKLYIFEECAVFCTLHGLITYPSNELNSANDYAVRKFNPQQEFLGYGFPNEYQKKGVQEVVLENVTPDVSETIDAALITRKSESKLIKRSIKTIETMNQLGLKSKQQQLMFFHGCIELIEKCSEKNFIIDSANVDIAQREAPSF